MQESKQEESNDVIDGESAADGAAPVNGAAKPAADGAAYGDAAKEAKDPRASLDDAERLKQTLSRKEADGAFAPCSRSSKDLSMLCRCTVGSDCLHDVATRSKE